MENRNNNRECRHREADERGDIDRRNCSFDNNETLGSDVRNDCDCHHRDRDHFADTLEDAYNEGYRDGYCDGYEDGRENGRVEGYQEGYKAGYEKAKEEVLQFIKKNRCCRCCRWC
jgi:hypothetical protein